MFYREYSADPGGRNRISPITSESALSTSTNKFCKVERSENEPIFMDSLLEV